MARMERMPVMLPAFEKAAIERQAAAAGMSISAWVRQRLTADLTGDLLAQQVATLVGQHTDPRRPGDLPHRAFGWDRQRQELRHRRDARCHRHPR